MRVAVLGMGRMGRALAGRFLGGGHEVVVWNRSPGRTSELCERGATEAASIVDAVADAAIAVTSLSSDDAVRVVARGEGGIHSSLSPGAVYVDASTVSPTMSSELEGAFERFVAMPVLGSPGAVAAGEAAYLLGGEPEAVAALDPLLPSLSNRMFRYDAAALASTAKLTVNLLLLAAVAALAESFAVGRSGGLSDDQLRELLGSSPLLAPGLKNRFEGLLTGEQDPWWSTALGAKDGRLACRVAAETGIELPVTELVAALYQRVSESGSGDDDLVAIAQLYRT